MMLVPDPLSENKESDTVMIHSLMMLLKISAQFDVRKES